MTSRLKITWLLCLSLLVCGLPLAAQNPQSTVLPNGRQIHPVGRWISVAPYPFALSVRPDGRQIAVPSIGFPFALNVISAPDREQPVVERFPKGEGNDPAVEVHTGLAYSPDGTLHYAATGDSGKIRLYQSSDWQAVKEVSLDGALAAAPDNAARSGSFAATLLLSADGKTLYALDQGNWRIVILDAVTLQRIAEIPTGNDPFGLALSPDGKRLYVTNTGLFEYTTLPGVRAEDTLGTGLHSPPFGYPSRAARDGALVEGKQVPGLGSLNLEDALAGEIGGVFDTVPHPGAFVARAADPAVFDPARARIAKPANKAEAAALRDVDDADAIRKEVEKSATHLHKPEDKD